MSFQPPSFENPYQPPLTTSRPGTRSPELPLFCKVILIIDVILCSLRFLLACFGIVGYVMLSNNGNPMMTTALFEVITGFGIALSGIPGNILMLLKKEWAVYLGYCNLAATLASVGVGIWQFTFVLNQFPADSPQRIGAIIGGAFASVVRLGIAGLYTAALVQFSQRVHGSSASRGEVGMGYQGPFGPR